MTSKGTAALELPIVRCLTADQVAEVLQVHPSTVYRLMKSGALPSVRVGSAGRRVTTKALEAFLDAGGAAA